MSFESMEMPYDELPDDNFSDQFLSDEELSEEDDLIEMFHNDDVAKLTQILSSSAKSQKEKDKLFFTAAWNYASKCMDVLVEAKASVQTIFGKEDGQRGEMAALNKVLLRESPEKYKKQAETVRKLIGLKADVTRFCNLRPEPQIMQIYVGGKPLYCAVFSGNPELVKILLDAKVSPNQMSGFPEYEEGADIVDEEGNLKYFNESPLHGAVRAQNQKIVELLIEARADLSLLGPEGNVVNLARMHSEGLDDWGKPEERITAAAILGLISLTKGFLEAESFTETLCNNQDVNKEYSSASLE